MKTISQQEVFDLIQKEVEFNLDEANHNNDNLAHLFKLGILDANERLIELQKQILDMK